jgi:hypothetical protein
MAAFGKYFPVYLYFRHILRKWTPAILGSLNVDPLNEAYIKRKWQINSKWGNYTSRT